MRKFTASVFVAALLAASFAIPASAEGDCGVTHSTKTVATSTPDNNVADSSTSQSTLPGK